MATVKCFRCRRRIEGVMRLPAQPGQIHSFAKKTLAQMLTQSVCFRSTFYILALAGMRTTYPHFTLQNLSKNKDRRYFYILLQRYAVLQRRVIDSKTICLP